MGILDGLKALIVEYDNSSEESEDNEESTDEAEDTEEESKPESKDDTPDKEESKEKEAESYSKEEVDKMIAEAVKQKPGLPKTTGRNQGGKFSNMDTMSDKDILKYWDDGSLKKHLEKAWR